MNPFDLSSSDLLVWGIVLHLIADWPLQNDWMANNKMKRRKRRMIDYNISSHDVYVLKEGPVWDRHLAAYCHAWIHGIALSLIFGWAAIGLGLLHLIIDTRVPVVWWSKWFGQTQPAKTWWINQARRSFTGDSLPLLTDKPEHNKPPLMDVGMEVRFWTDQVFHIACIAVAALLTNL